MGELEPSRDTALILRVELPPGLEALRLRHVTDANEGLPAHVTLLYPFAVLGSISDDVLALVRGIAAGHAAWSLRLGGLGRWPDALYATVMPDAPVRELQADLAVAFPTLPLYGEPRLRFEPHVTVVEGRGVGDPAVAADPAWGELPVMCRAGEVELIVRAGGRWSVAKKFPLAVATGSR